MKTIFIIGDSNTFGFNPLNGGRYDRFTRWTGILADDLGDDYRVINHGQNNRTFFSPNPNDPEISGLKVLEKRLTDKIDFVILALGINDTQIAYCADENKHIKAINDACNIIKEKAPKALMILTSPPIINESIMDSYFETMFDKASILKSENLPEIYKQEAKKLCIPYIDINEITPTSDIDGLHYTKQSHILIAEYFSMFFKFELANELWKKKS